MTPALMEGDIVAWTPTNIEDVEIGDVIVYRSVVHWPDEKIVVHRVSDKITNSFGGIELETKGDNNDFTDQVGAHVLEGYVVQDNLMGKVLSIGQVPLKIPLIGYLGIWINQGLNSLSQPSTSKGSLSYVGIFAPLTISVVILVVLIFVIPEKAVTIKEKIHLNIFGRRPLNMKKTLITFLIAYIVFLSVIHVFAYDSTTASVGVEEKSPDSGLNFGRVTVGSESFDKNLPLINPGAMPVKGIIFSRGEISPFVEGKVFQLQNGEETVAQVRAKIPNATAAGAYTGEILLFSSPFWFIFPDDFIQSMVSWNAEATIFILDFITGLILTGITVFILIAVTFAGDKIGNWLIDRSWYHPARIIVKRKTVKKVTNAKERAKSFVGRGVSWLINLNFSDIKLKDNFSSYVKKPIVASILIFPIIFFLEDKMLAMFISIFIAAILAYLISCKVRSKIVLTVLFTMGIAIAHMLVETNLIILSQERTMVELMALLLGAIGIYLLVLAILLVPFAIATWLIARFIRNLKERKDPLLSLEGSCDL